MEAILMKAASFIAVIILGYGLRKAGFFKEEDFYVLSKIVLKITLPASIIANFSQAEIQPAMLLLCLVGFAGGVLYMSLGWILGGKDRDEKAFHILNMSGYNIGNFTMPFNTPGMFRGYANSDGEINVFLFK
jgi:predicted permease